MLDAAVLAVLKRARVVGVRKAAWHRIEHDVRAGQRHQRSWFWFTFSYHATVMLPTARMASRL